MVAIEHEGQVRHHLVHRLGRLEQDEGVGGGRSADPDVDHVAVRFEQVDEVVLRALFEQVVDEELLFGILRRVLALAILLLLCILFWRGGLLFLLARDKK